MPSEPVFELERLVFFSDAVFAIAITLLVIDIRIPDELADQDVVPALVGILPNVAAFALSFAVIGTYWIAHHRIFRYIERWDGGLIVWNLVLLFFVAIQPATTSVIGHHGDLSLPTMIYAIGLAATGIASTGLWLHASRAGLVSSHITPRQGRFLALRAAIVPAVFLLSLPLVLVSPLVAQISWLLIWPAQALLQRRVGGVLPVVAGERRWIADHERR